jgi:SAM-dependent methyltransferase
MIKLIDRARLYPPITRYDYLHLTGLRKAVQEFVYKHVVARNVQLVLDVGAGHCPYRPLIAPLVSRYFTIDFPGTNCDFDIQPDGGVLLPDGEAEVVISTMVLEHTENPQEHLSLLRRLLAPHGKLLLSVPAKWQFHPCPDDYWRWTGPGLKRELEDADFQVIEIVGVVGLAAAGLQLFYDGIKNWIPEWLTPLSSLCLTAIMSLVEKVDRSNRQVDAGAFVVTACKKFPPLPPEGPFFDNAPPKGMPK